MPWAKALTLALSALLLPSAASFGLQSSGVSDRRDAVAQGASAVAAAVAAACSAAPPARAFAGDGSLPREEVLRAAEKLTDFQRAISLDAATERPFTGAAVNGYPWDVKGAGTWVGALSGAPLFDQSAKYDSGTGWPSFSAALPGAVIERLDPRDLANPRRAIMMGGVRTEVIDAASGAHLGHVFDDGPRPTGKRYCMNAGAMAFVPAK